MFKRNEGIIDRLVRVSVGLVLTPVGFFALGGLQGKVAGIVFIALGTLALVTGVTGYCPTYVLFGISTLDKERELIAKFSSMTASCRANMGTWNGPMCWPGLSSREKKEQLESQIAADNR